MKKIIYLILLIVLIPIQLFGQWALWSNPSLPVGSSDQGVGLGAGDIMVGANFNYQFIDWSHKDNDNEGFDHAGTLSATVFTPNITIGITDFAQSQLGDVIFVELPEDL